MVEKGIIVNIRYIVKRKSDKLLKDGTALTAGKKRSGKARAAILEYWK